MPSYAAPTATKPPSHCLGPACTPDAFMCACHCAACDLAARYEIRFELAPPDADDFAFNDGDPNDN
jgi:hypothetical protein